jgi:hypothetical protein
MFRQGGREDLARAEEAEVNLLSAYLPKGLDEEEIRSIVKKVIEETGAKSMSDIGKVMPEVMKRGQGRIDGKLAQKLVRELLG